MKRCFIAGWCVAAIALLLCYACNKEQGAHRIVLYGDSITAEYGAAEGSYTRLVQEKFHADTVYRQGYCGHRYSSAVSATHGGPSWLGSYVDDVCSHTDADLIILLPVPMTMGTTCRWVSPAIPLRQHLAAGCNIF